MNCEDFHHLLIEEPDAERQARLFAHAADCAACRQRLEFESMLQRQLRTLPIPAPRPGFAERVLANAHRAQRDQARTRASNGAQRPALIWAMAASLVLALGLWIARTPLPHQGMGQGIEQPRIAQVNIGQPSQVQSVRLMFRSEKALSGVTIELGLPEGVELAGYPDQRQLSWQTDLQSGPNLLDLPVLVSRGGGVLTATLNLGGERRQFSVRVQAADQSLNGWMKQGASSV